MMHVFLEQSERIVPACYSEIRKWNNSLHGGRLHLPFNCAAHAAQHSVGAEIRMHQLGGK
jgi:hypothetical protein